jgi:hypothetical protein
MQFFACVGRDLRRARRFLETHRSEYLAEKRRLEAYETASRMEAAAAWRAANARRMAELRAAAQRSHAEACGHTAASGDGGARTHEPEAVTPWARVLALIDAPSSERAASAPRASHLAQSRMMAFYNTLARAASAGAPPADD